MCIRDSYRSPLNFSADLMESSKNALERITEAAARLRDRQAAATVQEATEDEKKLMQEEAAFVTKFEESMDDDFNTADALAAVFELVKFANTNVQEGSSKEFAGHTLEVMTKLCDVLGLTLEKKEEILDEEIEKDVYKRQIVYGTKTTYILCVMSENASNAIANIRNISRVVYNYLNL